MSPKQLELWLAANAMLAARDTLQGDATLGEWLRFRNAVAALEQEANEAAQKEAQLTMQPSQQSYSRREVIQGRSPAIDQFCHLASGGPQVEWTDPDLAEVVRVRLVGRDGDPFYELLYSFGLMKDGTACGVILPFECLAMPRKGMREHLARVAQEAGLLVNNKEVYLSLFRALSTSQ